MFDQERHDALQRGSLIVFTRYPRPGKSKTRLIEALGPEKAARLQFHILRRVLRAAEGVRGRDKIRICFEGGTVAGLRSLLGSGWVFRRQAEGDLGRKMLLALRSAQEKDSGPLVLIGSDCPDMSSDILNEAFAVLEDRDIVLGPAVDGGFYLLGISGRIGARRIEHILSGIAWGTASVLEQTLQRAGETGLTCGFTGELNDLDVPGDLPDDLSRLFDSECSKISVIVPALNEEKHLGSSLAGINRGDNVQVVVADGGSTDQTLRIAADLGAETVKSSGGRARQMNEGTKRAKGEILLFVHADTEMPFLYDWYIRRAVHEEGYAGGAFSFSLDRPFPGSDWLAFMVNMRSRLLRMPYGDQALFVDKRLFRSIGGYPQTPLLEDVKLITNIKKTGRIVILPAAVRTSSRRWREKGLIRTTFINQLVMFGFCLGISTDTLASLYKK